MKSTVPGLLTALCAHALLALAGTAHAQRAPVIEAVDLGQGLYVFRAWEQQSLFLVGNDGVIVTDPMNPDVAAAYRRAIARITDQPVKFVVYSTSFIDRAAGGELFKEEGAVFVAHENCAANIAATPHPDIVMPDVTYSRVRGVAAGDVALELYYFGDSLGTCLSVMIARPANVMLVAGLVNPPAAAVPADPTLGNYYLHNIVPFFIAVEALAAERGVEQIIGIAAPPTENSQLGPVTLISEQREFWETLLAIGESEFNNKVPAREMQEKADLEPLAIYAGYDRDHVGIMMRRVYSLYRIGR